MKYPETESSTLEFKAALPQYNQIVKTVVGFCNQHGGKIIVGVENDGTIKGLNQQEIEQALEYLNNTVYQDTVPSILPFIYTQTIGDKTVLIIEVSSGMNKPYFVKSEKLSHGTYIRLGRSTLRATPEIIEELKLTSRGRSFDFSPVYQAHLDDLDYSKIEYFFLHRKAIPELPPVLNEALAAYHITTDQHGHVYPTVAGTLLFAKDREKFFSEAFIICTHYAGREGREALSHRDCQGTLFEQFREANSFVVSRLNRSFTIKGPIREEKLEIPEVAVREAIINALIHRNYNILSPIKISIYDNRIEIFSPGGFPGPMNPKNIKKGLTYIRNVAIAKIFREAGYSEKMGTGFHTIFSSYEAYNLKEPEIIEGENFIKCILPRGITAVKPEKSSKSHEEKQINDLFEKANELSAGEIVALLRIPRSTASRRLTELLKKGVIAKKGVGSGTRYLLM